MLANLIGNIKLGKYIAKAGKPLWWAIIGLTGALITGGLYSWMLLISMAVGKI